MRRETRLLRTVIAALASLCAPVAACAWGGDDVVSARVRVFKEAKASLRTIRSALSDGELPRVAAEAHRLDQIAVRIPSLFPPGSGPDQTRTSARSDIWADKANFDVKANALRVAAEALADAAQAGDATSARTRADAVAATCKSCHTAYKD